MKYKKVSDAGEMEQKRFDKIPFYELGKTPESINRNKYRCITIKRAILASYEDAEDDIGSALTDVLADLRHLCDAVGLDFFDHDKVAYGHYSAEMVDSKGKYKVKGGK